MRWIKTKLTSLGKSRPKLGSQRIFNFSDDPTKKNPFYISCVKMLKPSTWLCHHVWTCILSVGSASLCFPLAGRICKWHAGMFDIDQSHAASVSIKPLFSLGYRHLIILQILVLVVKRWINTRYRRMFLLTLTLTSSNYYMSPLSLSACFSHWRFAPLNVFFI